MPNVIYYTSSFSRQSGATHTMLRTAREISRRGWKKVWLAVPERDRAEVAQVAQVNEIFEKIYYVRGAYKLSRRLNPLYYVRYLFDSIMAIKNLYHWLRENPVALVHANDLLDFHAAIAGWLLGAKIVWHLRTVRPLSVVWPFVWLMRTISSKILAVSHKTANRMLGNDIKKLAVVYNTPPDSATFDPDKYTATSRTALRRSLGIAETDFVLGFVGKLVRIKGHEFFIRAGRRFLNQHPNCKLVIVGGPVKGHEKYAQSLYKLADKLGLNGNLLLTGFRADVPELISIFDVMLVTSIYDDPFPGVVLQGMAMGKPVVASRLGGIPEIIDDGINGFLVNPRDPEKTAALMSNLLTDPVTRNKIGAAARQKVYAKFHDDFLTINQIYDSLLNGKAG
jgi:glycosyltransferase involved in cell wall biosynthesis